MRIFGHPLHPTLVHFPIVFWTVAVAAYVSVVVAASDSATMIAKYSNGAGLIMALVAMIAGLLELRSIDSGSAAMRVATQHMMMMATAWFCFLLAMMLSISAGLDRVTAQFAEVAAAGVGFLLMSVGGWFGGRLVYEFGIAVRNHAKGG
jgi:uncharacterized membrane protein